VDGSAVARVGDIVEFGSVLLRVADRDESIAPVWSDDAEISSNSIFLSRDEITNSHKKVSGGDPALIRLLSDAGQLMVLPEAPEQTFDRVLALVENAIPAGRTLLLLQEEEGKDRCSGPRARRPNVAVDVEPRWSAWCWTRAAPSYRRRPVRRAFPAPVHRRPGSAFGVAVPLVHHNEVLGLLYVDTSTRWPPTPATCSSSRCSARCWARS
jgi:hypothetical protein